MHTETRVCLNKRCDASFDANVSKKQRYCSATCRAQAGNARKVQKIADMIRSGEIDIDALAAQLVNVVDLSKLKKKAKPVKLHKGHRDVLRQIEIMKKFTPSLATSMPANVGRRCRELRDAGLVESYRENGRAVFTLVKK